MTDKMIATFIANEASHFNGATKSATLFLKYADATIQLTFTEGGVACLGINESKEPQIISVLDFVQRLNPIQKG